MKSQPQHRDTALLLVDVIASFFHPSMPNYFAEAERTLAPMAQLLAQARASGALVVHAVERHRPGLQDFEWRKLPEHHLEGAADAAIMPGFEPLPEREPVVPKRRYSAFFATDLALLLQEQGIRRVLIAGVKTNVCIRATAQDAFAHGMEPVIVREATASNRTHLAEASLEDMALYMGRVVDLAEGLELLA